MKSTENEAMCNEEEIFRVLAVKDEAQASSAQSMKSTFRSIIEWSTKSCLRKVQSSAP